MPTAIASKPILAFTKADIFPANDGFAVKWPSDSEDTVLSINSRGDYETRPVTKPDGTSGIGTNETFKKSGDKLVCEIPEGVFVIPYVEY